MEQDKKTILFVCTGNTCRSPMAEIMFSAMLKDSEFKSASAGLAAINNDCATYAAVSAMEEIGLDLTSHSSRRLTREIAEDAYRIITMTHEQKLLLLKKIPEAAEKTVSFKEIIGEDIDDPFFQNKDVYLITAEKIRLGLDNLCQEIINKRINKNEVE